MISTQMLKGTLEGCILGIIRKKETYGYEISEALGKYGFGKITEGTIYPILLRLEKQELVSAIYRQSDVGPKRKYYSLTEKGEAEFQNYLTGYRELFDAVTALLDDVCGGNVYEENESIT